MPFSSPAKRVRLHLAKSNSCAATKEIAVSHLIDAVQHAPVLALKALMRLTS